MKMKLNKKQLSLLISLLLLLTVSVGGTLAYIVTQTTPVKNTFTPAEVTCHITDTMNTSKTEKTDAYVTNTGDVDAYIRVALVFTWRDAEGNIAPVAVKASDYSLSLGSNWAEVNGYYYYKSAVEAGDKTEDLIESCKLAENVTAPVGYGLCVEILADAIQADGVASDGTKPVVKAWGVDPSELQ